MTRLRRTRVAASSAADSAIHREATRARYLLLCEARSLGTADDFDGIFQRVQVAPGAHRIEVRKDGYRGYDTQVDVRAGETTPVNVSRPRQNEQRARSEAGK